MRSLMIYFVNVLQVYMLDMFTSDETSEKRQKYVLEDL